MMEKILTLLVGLLIALGGWSLSRTFELSTGQAVLEDKVERLEMQVRLMDEKMDEMFDMDEEIMKQHEDLFKKLENSGIRATKQRRVLAKLIFDKGKRHISAENLFDEVKREERKISMATVYNTLKQFTSLGLIKEIVVDQNKSLYCNNNQSHYHLYIEDEGKVIDIPTKNIDLDIPSIPACLQLHDIDVIVRIRTLKDKKS